METRNESMSKDKWQTMREDKRNTVREMERLMTGEAMTSLKLPGMKKGAPESYVLGPKKDR